MERLDKYLHLKSYATSRSKAEQLIIQGKVKVNGKLIKKTSYKVSLEDTVEVEDSLESKYVSRAALKLLTAYDIFSLDIQGKKVLDIGSSTGGFIQVLLEKGADEVFGVDVGQDQLHTLLKNNERVKNFEKCNAREPLPFSDKFDLITCDVSFISITLILPNVLQHLNDNGFMVFLLKPQFESKGENLKNGVVPLDKHEKIFQEMRDFLKGIDFQLLDSCPSRVLGKAGNQEYLWLIKKKMSNQY